METTPATTNVVSLLEAAAIHSFIAAAHPLGIVIVEGVTIGMGAYCE